MYQVLLLKKIDMISVAIECLCDFLHELNKYKNYTAFWYVLFYIIFLLIGGIGVLKEASEPVKNFGLENTSWKNTYITIALGAPLVWALYLYGLQWLFSLEFLMSKSAFIEVINFFPATSENALQYAMFAVMRVILFLFLYIRYLIIGIIAAYLLLIVAARLFSYTSGFAKLFINYGILMLFSRFIMVLILMGGFAFVKNLPAPLNYLPVGYLMVMILVTLFAICCLLYPIIYLLFKSPVKYLKVR